MSTWVQGDIRDHLPLGIAQWQAGSGSSGLPSHGGSEHAQVAPDARCNSMQKGGTGKSQGLEVEFQVRASLTPRSPLSSCCADSVRASRATRSLATSSSACRMESSVLRPSASAHWMANARGTGTVSGRGTASSSGARSVLLWGRVLTRHVTRGPNACRQQHRTAASMLSWTTHCRSPPHCPAESHPFRPPAYLGRPWCCDASLWIPLCPMPEVACEREASTAVPGVAQGDASSIPGRSQPFGRHALGDPPPTHTPVRQ